MGSVFWTTPFQRHVKERRRRSKSNSGFFKDATSVICSMVGRLKDETKLFEGILIQNLIDRNDFGKNGHVFVDHPGYIQVVAYDEFFTLEISIYDQL